MHKVDLPKGEWAKEKATAGGYYIRVLPVEKTDESGNVIVVSVEDKIDHKPNKKDFSDKIVYMKSYEVKDALTKNIVIENLDFSVAMNKDYTGKDFMFLDPPYDSTFSEYDGNAFGRDKHQQLSEILKKANCKWMLVIKNTEFIYNLYSGWANIMSFDKTYMYHTRGSYDQNVEHLIITNY